MKHSKIMLIIIGLMLISLASFSMASQEYPMDWDDYWGDSSEEAAFLFGLGLTMCLVIFLIPLIIAILLCIWIYKDANKRGKSGGLWVLLLILCTLFFNFIGLIVIIIIWLIVRPPIQGSQTTINQTIHAGNQQQSSERRCPSCGRVIPNDARVCPYCEKKFEE